MTVSIYHFLPGFPLQLISFLCAYPILVMFQLQLKLLWTTKVPADYKSQFVFGILSIYIVVCS